MPSRCTRHSAFHCSGSSWSTSSSSLRREPRRPRGSRTALKQLVTTKIIGPQGQHPKGSLVESLLQTIPPAGTSSPTASLYTLTQDNAIETAQVAVLNGLSITKNGAFGISKVQHY